MEDPGCGVDIPDPPRDSLLSAHSIECKGSGSASRTSRGISISLSLRGDGGKSNTPATSVTGSGVGSGFRADGGSVASGTAGTSEVLAKRLGIDGTCKDHADCCSIHMNVQATPSQITPRLENPGYCWLCALGRNRLLCKICIHFPTNL